MSAHTHTLRHTDTRPHTVTHTDRQHKRFLLICCICYGAHLLASSSMCVLSTEYIYVCMWCACVCAAIASVCYLCCDNRFKRFTHSPSKCNLSSFSWTLTWLPPTGCRPRPAPCHLCPRCPALYTAWRPLAPGTVF